ncbi:Uncharacterized protein APZ42_019123 [Daphnia magna]|uniref:Uncharacterized protein n=1 Tax=Daphnia magna TaxID=35525 RepID=A0A164YK39_9CRUS|nr:Uncharacterized protein APZ42_019123 [Daphnia magna]
MHGDDTNLWRFTGKKLITSMEKILKVSATSVFLFLYILRNNQP